MSQISLVYIVAKKRNILERAKTSTNVTREEKAHAHLHMEIAGNVIGNTRYFAVR